MARRRSYHRKRRQGRFSFLYKILIFVAICGAIAVALALAAMIDYAIGAVKKLKQAKKL